jgi:uncharacterized iron-regulated protein
MVFRSYQAPTTWRVATKKVVLRKLLGKEIFMKWKVTLTAISLVFSFSSCATKLELYDTSSETFYSLEDGVKELQDSGYLILGETHYQEDIQKAQGIFINQVVKEKGRDGDFTVAWEFLNYPDQQKLENALSLYRTRAISIEQVLEPFFGQNPGKHLLYRPLFDSAKNLNGHMVATNAPREWKRKIVEGGIANLDPKYVPANMERGPALYFERFETAMGGHAPSDKLENYFLAQSFTDAVMAKSLVDLSQGELNFMIVGHFHSDFDHGLPFYLKKLTAEQVTHVRMMDFTGLTLDQQKELLTPHTKYGAVAPWILVINR